MCFAKWLIRNLYFIVFFSVLKESNYACYACCIIKGKNSKKSNYQNKQYFLNETYSLICSNAFYNCYCYSVSKNIFLLKISEKSIFFSSVVFCITSSFVLHYMCIKMYNNLMFAYIFKWGSYNHFLWLYIRYFFKREILITGLFWGFYWNNCSLWGMLFIFLT